jgi:hypothetical protein
MRETSIAIPPATRSQNGWKVIAIISMILFVILLAASAVFLTLASLKDKYIDTNEAISNSKKSGYKTINVIRNSDADKPLYVSYPNDWQLTYDDGYRFGRDYRDKEITEFDQAKTKIHSGSVSVEYNVYDGINYGVTCQSYGTGNILAIRLTKTDYDKVSLMEVAIASSHRSNEVLFRSNLVVTGTYDYIKVGDSSCQVLDSEYMNNDDIGLESDSMSDITVATITVGGTNRGQISDEISGVFISETKAKALMDGTKFDDAYNDVEEYQIARQILLGLSEKS